MPDPVSVAVSEPFAGDLFLRLAAEGRLVIDAVRADQLIAGLEGTLELVVERLRLLGAWRRVPGELSQPVVDALFVDQLAPGRLEEALLELPKYIEALRTARRAC